MPEHEPHRGVRPDEPADNERFAYCPLLYGYTNSARAGSAPRQVSLADIPGLDGANRAARRRAPDGYRVVVLVQSQDISVDYAFWIAHADCQKSLYFDDGGQPGFAAAWDDPFCNAVAHEFFKNTRVTMDNSYSRPRHERFTAFQDRGGKLINEFLVVGGSVDQLIERLEAGFAASFVEARTLG